MKAPKDMTAGEINKALDRLDKKRSKITDEFIDSGRGNERWSEISQQTDPLSLRAQAVESDRDALVYEIRRRMGPNHPSRLPPGRFFGPLGSNPLDPYRWW